MSRAAITLKPVASGAIEAYPRFEVQLHGKKWGELYHNMTGYRGNLPLPGGKSLWMPEASLSEFKREIAKINREFKAAGA